MTDIGDNYISNVDLASRAFSKLCTKYSILDIRARIKNLF